MLLVNSCSLEVSKIYGTTSHSILPWNAKIYYAERAESEFGDSEKLSCDMTLLTKAQLQ